MPRPIWTGHISFGLVEIPVSLVSAVNKNDISFSQLDGRDHAKVGYKRVNKTTGEEVPYDQIVKGYEHEEGWVVLTRDEIRDAYPRSNSSVDIIAFVDATEIDRRYYDTPYYLIPGGKKKRLKAYALLRETLRESGKVALAKVVMRTRQYLCALFPLDDALVMQTLRFGFELRDTADLELPGRDLDELGVTDQERQLADMLVSNLSAEFTPDAYADDYRDKVLAYIEKKAREGEVTVLEEVGESGDEGSVVDIMELLKKSVEAARKAG